MALKDLVVRGPRPPVASRPKKRGPYKISTTHVRGESLDPQHISDTTWFYDDRRGLLVVHEFRGPRNEYLRTDQFIIPWAKVRAALLRNGKI